MKDKDVLNKLHVTKTEVLDEDPNDVWHVHTVELSDNDINKIRHQINDPRFYMHFWDKDKIKVLFQDKDFTLDRHNKESWKPAIQHGVKLGIPKEQLDFLTDDR